jgi:hypothetical protein
MSTTRKLILVFIDGLGIGPKDPAVNPLARFTGSTLNFFQDGEFSLKRGGVCVPTDATLAVDGLPQSATGQTTLFTGENAAQLLGYHLQGFPNQQLRERLAERSLFRQILDRGRPVTFANVYTPRFFNTRPRWVSATTVMCESAGVRLRTMEDLLRDRGLFMDFTNRWLLERQVDVEKRTCSRAAAILAGLAEQSDFVLYEYFITDLVGHRGSLAEGVKLARELDDFLSALVDELDLESTSLVVCSDHGNFEDFSCKTHTRNDVPTLLWGPIRDYFDSRTQLDSISPAVVQYFSGNECDGLT